MKNLVKYRKIVALRTLTNIFRRKKAFFRITNIKQMQLIVKNETLPHTNKKHIW